MVTSRFVTLAGTTLFGLCAVALVHASPGETGPGKGGKHERGPIVLAEAEKRMAERSAAMDIDGDGFVTADEALAHHKSMQDERTKRRFERRHGERISVQELTALRLERIAKLDANGDGTIDREERMAAREKMRGHGRGRGGHGGHHND
jgi:hypothetical protein